MPRRTTPRLIITSLIALMLASTPTAATADTITFTDRVGDIPAGIDIRNVRVRNEERLIVTVQHRDLRRSDPVRGLGIFIDTKAARRGPEFFFSGGVGEGTDWNIFHARKWKAGRGPIFCSTDFNFNYRTDVTRTSIARGCLNEAGRVRVSVLGSTNSKKDWAPGYHRFSAWVPRG